MIVILSPKYWANHGKLSSWKLIRYYLMGDLNNSATLVMLVMK